MWVALTRTRGLPILLEAGGVIVIAVLTLVLGGPIFVPAEQDDWVDAMREAVLVEQTKEGPFWGTYEPYLTQLEVVRIHHRKGDVAAVYAGMNCFMDMLERRVNGIPDVTADWLFDYCYAVTPARYHDVSRHIEKYRKHQFEEGARPDESE